MRENEVKLIVKHLDPDGEGDGHLHEIRWPRDGGLAIESLDGRFYYRFPDGSLVAAQDDDQARLREIVRKSESDRPFNTRRRR